jgi:hypothetical protein
LQPRQQRSASNGFSPSSQSDPRTGVRRADTPDAVTNPTSGLTTSKAREGETDGPSPEVPSSHDSRRHDRDHRVARQAAKPANLHDNERRRLIRREVSSNLPLAYAVSDDFETPPRRTRPDLAPRALGRADPICRRHPRQPKLDLDIRMNDMTLALGTGQKAPEHDEAVARLVTYFVGRISSVLRLRRPLLRHPR